MTKFSDFFKDRNDINEKTVIGTISFIIMLLFAVADLLSGIFGWKISIHEYIYNSFLMLTLGVFGISTADKYINKKFSDSDKPEEPENPNDDSSTSG